MTQTAIAKIPGLSSEDIKKFQSLGFFIIEVFLVHTRTKKGRDSAAKALGLDREQMASLRERAKSQLKSEKHIGVTYAHYETGTEGVMWAILEDGKTGYDALHIVDVYDHLVISDGSGKTLFDGEIKPDFKKGARRRNPDYPKSGQPCALGFWVHWTQKGWEPDDWARLFLRSEFGKKPLRAELTKNPPKNV